MFAPGVGGWPTAGCPGCSMVVDHIGPLEPIAHLQRFAEGATRPFLCIFGVDRLEVYERVREG